MITVFSAFTLCILLFNVIYTNAQNAYNTLKRVKVISKLYETVPPNHEQLTLPNFQNVHKVDQLTQSLGKTDFHFPFIHVVILFNQFFPHSPVVIYTSSFFTHLIYSRRTSRKLHHPSCQGRSNSLLNLFYRCIFMYVLYVSFVQAMTGHAETVFLENTLKLLAPIPVLGLTSSLHNVQLASAHAIVSTS